MSRKVYFYLSFVLYMVVYFYFQASVEIKDSLIALVCLGYLFYVIYGFVFEKTILIPGATFYPGKDLELRKFVFFVSIFGVAGLLIKNLFNSLLK